MEMEIILADQIPRSQCLQLQVLLNHERDEMTASDVDLGGLRRPPSVERALPRLVAASELAHAGNAERLEERDELLRDGRGGEEADAGPNERLEEPSVAVGKIEAALEKRLNDDFAVVARTEALIQGHGEAVALEDRTQRATVGVAAQSAP